MKFVKQLTIILFISFLGEGLHALLPLPVPASVYGLLLMLGGLLWGIIQLESVRETGKFLVQIMPVLFIAPGVGLMEAWGVLQPIWLPVAVILLVSLVVVFASAGWVTQLLLRRKENKHE